jgi:hypothetical protein
MALGGLVLGNSGVSRSVLGVCGWSFRRSWLVLGVWCVEFPAQPVGTWDLELRRSKPRCRIHPGEDLEFRSAATLNPAPTGALTDEKVAESATFRLPKPY